ncbi:MAG: hypothetical protein C4583_09105 [Anaerolineaceae bacterium]|nr:MAG: hypothetical protein C4583_09105 [Anaerolineaceae bacterium]
MRVQFPPSALKLYSNFDGTKGLRAFRWFQTDDRPRMAAMHRSSTQNAARPPFGGLALLMFIRHWAFEEKKVKLYLFFIVMDALILLAYPFLFIASKLREILKNKR